MEDKEIMKEMNDMERRIIAQVNEIATDFNKKVEAMPCSENNQRIRGNDDGVKNLREDFSKYATLHDNYHSLYWKKIIALASLAFAAISAICAAATVIALKWKGL